MTRHYCLIPVTSLPCFAFSSHGHPSFQAEGRGFDSRRAHSLMFRAVPRISRRRAKSSVWRRSQLQLAEEFVAKNLEEHMFAGEPDAATKAKEAAAWFPIAGSFAHIAEGWEGMKPDQRGPRFSI